MGWQVNVLENTVTFEGHVVAEQLQDYLSQEHDVTVNEPNKDGKYELDFDSEAMEHIDYMLDDEVQKLLKDGRANGRVCFGQVEGDGGPSQWGYEFENGEMFVLNAKITWVRQEKKKK